MNQKKSLRFTIFANLLVQEGPTVRLANFVSSLTYENLPSEVITKTKELILDQIGCELAGSILPWSKIAYEYIKSMNAGGKCTVVKYGSKTNPEFCSFLNATFGHGFDLDDMNGHGRPGSAIIAPILVSSELLARSGIDVITSVVAAYEVWTRVTAAVSPSAILDRGFHTVSINGVFGAAAGVGKLLRINAEKLANAFGIAGSHSSGLTEFTVSGSEVKRIHAGIAAVGGLRSAFLAKDGYTGPLTILEGKKGFCQAFANTYDISRLTENLSREWFIMKTGIKPYACATSIHPAILAIEKLLERHQFAPSDIESVIVGTNKFALGHGGGQIGTIPRDITGMQYSIQYSVALALIVRDNLFEGYSEANLTNREVISMAKRVKLQLDPEVDREYREESKLSSNVTVILADGRKFEERSYARGQPYFPLSKEEIITKFTKLSTMVIDSEQADVIANRVLRLEEETDTSSISSLLKSAL